MPHSLRALFLSLAVAAAANCSAARLQDAPPQADAAVGEVDENGDPIWPRVIDEAGRTFTIYQPQIDKFHDDTLLQARAAVQVDTPVDGKTQTAYGVIWISAHAFVDKENKLVQLDDIQITKASFPSAADKTKEYLDVLRRNVEKGRAVSLERIEADLAVTQAEAKGNAVPLKNDPPRIYYRTSPAILVLIDGNPVLRPVQGTSLRRVINTKILIVEDSGRFYMPIGDAWLGAPAATGPWGRIATPPVAAQALRDSLAKDETSQVDLFEDPGEDIAALLGSGKAPEIVVSTTPAELILTQGKPQMTPIAGTQLLYVSNTGGDIFLDLTSQLYYVALTGRWFRSKSLENGPWEFVPGDQLPEDFARIPENDPKAGVLATVPGTPAAKEAAIANTIPQTAEVKRDEATFEPQYDGDPRFDSIPDTSLQYAVNSPTPIVRVDDSSYYAVQGGVWFTAGSPWGPWAVATYVPPVIYTIPTASPIHYVTYVRVYRYDPDYVWVGYTPGYLGTCYSPWGTVVYGTGWYYTPWIGTYWYGSPWTWGFGVGVSWSPWTGWDVGFGWGGYVYYDPWWGPYRSWHHRSHWHDHDRYDYDRHDHRRDDHGRDDRGRDSGGRGGHGTGDRGRDSGGRQRSTAINQMNVYNRPGVARSGVRAVTRPSAQPASDSRSGARPSAGQTGGTRPAPGQSSVQPGTRPAEPAGRPSSGQPTTVQPGGRPITGQPTTQPAQAGGRPAGTQPTRDVYAGPDGNVYRPRPSGGGWETSDRGGWTPVQPRSGSSDWSRGEVSRPSVGGRTIDSGTYNQLSRDYQGRQNGNMRMSPGPSGPSHGAPPAPRHR